VPTAVVLIAARWPVADDSRDSLAQLQSMLQNAAGDEAAMIR
jgi:hypothetical protein